MSRETTRRRVLGGIGVGVTAGLAGCGGGGGDTETATETATATATSDGTVVASTDVALDGGRVCTIDAGGYLSPDDEPSDTPFRLVVSNDTE